ncbi:MAG TPA: DUF4199 domain-containing protein [Candidatus Coprenecus merdigallinarum]|nr:DUF4199 domain-containing protein [Candidatus Coprenecus merdigallinarum]
MNYKLNWSEAAKYGLILASVSVVINLVTSLFELPGFLNTILSAIKFCASVYIVYYAMKRNAEAWNYVSYGQSYGYGMAVCSLSAVVCTLFVLLTYTVFLPGSLTELLDQIFATYESMGVAGMLDYDALSRSMPVILILSQFIGCIICGLIVCAIVAGIAKKNDSNPFSNQDTQPSDNDTEE